MHCFIKHPELFRQASILFHLSDLKAKAERAGLRKRPSREIQARSPALEKALSGYLLSEDGRGRNCKIDIYPDRDRLCLIAHPEDFIKSDLEYKDNQLRKTSRRPSFEIVFIYYPDEGRLELTTKGGRKRENALFNIFNEIVLEDTKPVLEFQKIYDLNKLLDKDFAFTRELEDQIEYIQLKQIKFCYKYNPKKKITLELNEREGIQPAHEFIKELNINNNNVDVIQATIKMKFPGEGRKGGVTMQITHPDRCNLNDSPLHIRARKYLKSWGFENNPGA